ncbi:MULTISPECIES: CDP-diacylglycerol--serine O-phosphatidyltransferase [Aneurinibacillus]|uniref:CDP-diacylglycerol--serine O-phosphatidyltransferase n=2 Tax=Aneurinibacillus thermoaerophilus TaxID=143495 RepID=A0ABX8YG58_ANETH|nr:MULTISPECIES: CDP-diacylglycerol--serine O-phosphatidyltransferase [Aneurinibacillus]AMA74107.1 CDP-diacylglycerol--serine O-phosphatidyltransferase [Aneurinibacillus sp. XH2]MED0675484.1 CDP-diacylglycerol--serine O-phosphatidyltransferase [Aneurinibacillus thermoaerophilus]MED0678839.1 CDP-diacylglycerol--serine O-phosphatidyltransferase [Aneurinibacillus thermoaerophilus]MED0736712.1 CDP-diacylglycerol--serine O-phosphatidyltransferase [Aneurinibacillus thermoaerophilus]MED0758367.1 CDP-
MMSSIRRSIPNSFTLSNLVCGIFSLTFSMNGYYKMAALLILLAALCDVFDGKLARMLKVDSPMGVELDSLADIVSFGVAPAILIHTMHTPSPLLTIAFIAFPIAGAWRLGRFNIKPTVGYYMGVPITLAGLILAVLALFSFSSPLLMLILAVLMVSPIRIPKL